MKNGDNENTDCTLVNLKTQFLIIELPEEEAQVNLANGGQVFRKGELITVLITA